MSRPIIEVTGISKRYRLGAIGATSLRDEVSRYWDRLRGLSHPDPREFWALRDVSFSVQAGEVVGIIGRNGAGKSTLLKILSRITEPTSGRAVLRGRVASLLEVGTGFHPELTGRENIFLNGAILGMSRAEVRRKFDNIVSFAEVDEFIDTPVKRYSSGMYVRLAFAVAAHLDPEIMLVDEVLAVGDAAFQQKCLSKIAAMAKGGQTILFVSHSLSTLRLLCSHGVLLDHGRVRLAGSSTETLNAYLDVGLSSDGVWRRPPGPTPDAAMYFVEVSVRDIAGNAASQLRASGEFVLRLEVVSRETFENAQIAIRITNQDGIPVFTTCNTDVAKKFTPITSGRHVFEVPLDASTFMPGRYALKIAAHVPQSHLFDLIDDQLSFTIHDVGDHVNSLRDSRLGVVCPTIRWRHQVS